jgi:O-antigen/teichoic acid export membrane protein
MFQLEANTTLIFWITFINSFTLLFQSFDVIDQYFQAKVKSKYVVIARNSAFLLSTALKIYFVWFKFPLLAFAWTTLIELIFSAIFLIMAYQFDKEKIALWRYEKSVALSLLKESWPLLLSALMIIIYMRIDQIMIGSLLGAKEVGIYSAAVKLTEVWYFIPTSIAASVFPTIIKLKSINPALYKIRIQQMYVAMTWLALAISIPMTFLSDGVVNLIYGLEFADAGPVLAISIWSGIFVFQGVARGYWLVAEGLQNYSMYYIGGACLVNVSLNFWLIPLLGVKGAALATAISYFTSAIGFPFIFKKTRTSSVQLLKSFLWITK